MVKWSNTIDNFYIDFLHQNVLSVPNKSSQFMKHNQQFNQWLSQSECPVAFIEFHWYYCVRSSKELNPIRFEVLERIVTPCTSASILESLSFLLMMIAFRKLSLYIYRRLSIVIKHSTSLSAWTIISSCLSLMKYNCTLLL